MTLFALSLFLALNLNNLGSCYFFSPSNPVVRPGGCINISINSPENDKYIQTIQAVGLNTITIYPITSGTLMAASFFNTYAYAKTWITFCNADDTINSLQISCVYKINDVVFRINSPKVLLDYYAGIKQNEGILDIIKDKIMPTKIIIPTKKDSSTVVKFNINYVKHLSSYIYCNGFELCKIKVVSDKIIMNEGVVEYVTIQDDEIIIKNEITTENSYIILFFKLEDNSIIQIGSRLVDENTGFEITKITKNSIKFDKFIPAYCELKLYIYINKIDKITYDSKKENPPPQLYSFILNIDLSTNQIFYASNIYKYALFYAIPTCKENGIITENYIAYQLDLQNFTFKLVDGYFNSDEFNDHLKNSELLPNWRDLTIFICVTILFVLMLIGSYLVIRYKYVGIAYKIRADFTANKIKRPENEMINSYSDIEIAE